VQAPIRTFAAVTRPRERRSVPRHATGTKRSFVPFWPTVPTRTSRRTSGGRLCAGRRRTAIRSWRGRCSPPGRLPIFSRRCRARRGSLATVRVLLEHGADPDQRDPEGRTALEIAGEWASKDVEAELVARVDLLVGTLESGRKGAEVRATRMPLPDGTQLVSVRA